MPNWRVSLNGDARDLRTLAGLGVGVSEEDGIFVLRAPSLDKVTAGVEQHARELVAVVNGLARMTAPDFRAVTVNDLVGDDDGRIIVGPGIAEAQATAETVDVVMTDSVTREPIPSQPPRHGAWVPLAQRDPSVRRALGLFAGQPDPVNLYRVFEVIRADAGGENHIVGNGWTTQSQITRFRRTANSVSALGAEARHAVEATTPPADPMSQPEMQAFVTGLLEHWLASK